MMQGVGMKVARNSVYGAMRFLVAVPIIFFTTPYVLGKLGNERFGIWVLVGVITTYGLLSDMGITTALIKFVAEFTARGEASKVSSLVSTALSTYAVTGGLVAACVLIWQNAIIVDIFHVPAALVNEALFLVYGAVFVFMMTLASGAFNSVIVGMQRLDITNLVLLAYSIVDAAGLILVLHLGYGLRGMMLSRVTLATGLVLVNYLLARRVLPEMTCSPQLSNRKDLRRVLGFGLNLQIAGIAGTVVDSVNKLLISILVSLGAVVFWEVSWRIAGQVRGLFQAAMSSILPAATDIYARNGQFGVRSLYLRSIRFLVIIALPMYCIVFICAGVFIQLWLGTGYETAIRMTQILLLALFVGLMGVPAYEVLKATGKVRWCTYISVGMALLNVTTCWLLGNAFGFFGIVFGYCFSMIMSVICSLVACNHFLHVSALEFVGAIPIKAFAFGIMLGGMFSGGLILGNWGKIGWLGLALLATTYLSAYVFGVAKFGLLSPEDRRLFATDVIMKIWRKEESKLSPITRPTQIEV